MIIYKYPLDIINQWFDLPIPASSKILTMQNQPPIVKWDGQKTYIWAIVNGLNSKESPRKKLIAIGTGVPFDKVGMDGTERYIATAQDDTGFVWHLFEKGESDDED